MTQALRRSVSLRQATPGYARLRQATVHLLTLRPKEERLLRDRTRETAESRPETSAKGELLHYSSRPLPYLSDIITTIRNIFIFVAVAIVMIIINITPILEMNKLRFNVA